MPKKSNASYRRGSHRKTRPDDEPQINELLKTAGIIVNAKTRSDLVIAIVTARSANASEQEHQDQPTKELLEQLEISVTKTLGCLRRVKKHAFAKNIGFQVHSLENGIVKAMAIFQIGKHKEFPSIPDGTIIGIDIENLLNDWRAQIKKIPTRRRARPRRQDKDAIVLYAFHFFCRHSTRKPSNDLDNPFSAFAGQFYEVVTGAPPSRGLNSQIRKVLEARKKVYPTGLEFNGHKKPI